MEDLSGSWEYSHPLSVIVMGIKRFYTSVPAAGNPGQPQFGAGVDIVLVLSIGVKGYMYL